MKKRILSAALALTLAVGVLPAGAASSSEEVPLLEKAAVLKELEIMVGDASGDLRLGSTITRAEFVKLLVAASPYHDNVSATAGTDPYPDVSHRAWYAPYVRLAVDQGLCQGDLTGLFHPENPITLAEGVTMALRLLGYADSDFTSPWPGGQMGLYRALELDSGVSAQTNDDLMTRLDCLHLFYNLLTANTKSGAAYVTLLGYSLNADGEVDVSAVFTPDQDGGIPLTGSWQSLVPFDVSTALVYRDGERAALSDLKEWDILYWNQSPDLLFAFSQQSFSALSSAVEGPLQIADGWEAQLPFSLSAVAYVTRNGLSASLSDLQRGDIVYYSEFARSLAAYSKTVSGTVESVAPSSASPTAVTIAGVSYSLETLETQYAFSDLGALGVGDAVTLYLGRSGGAAKVAALSDADRLSQLAVVSSLSSQTYTDPTGQSYAQKTVAVITADAQRRVYPCADDDLEAGDLVEITQRGTEVTVKKANGKTTSGVVSADHTSLGTLALSPDVEILETYGDSSCRSVLPSRLAGVTLTASDVRGYTTDAAGTIDSLILNDVTGDLHSYGVLTKKETVNFQMILQGVYTVDISGQPQTLSVSGKVFSADKGPVAVKYDGGQLKDMRNLTQVKNCVLNGQTISANGTKYTLADNAAFYLYDAAEKEYTLSTRAQVTAAGLSLSAWYDQPDQNGGRVRVVVAQAK